MSLIRKHGAVLQAWACLALVSFLLVHVLDKPGSLPVSFPVQIIYRIVFIIVQKNCSVRTCCLLHGQHELFCLRVGLHYSLHCIICDRVTVDTQVDCRKPLRRMPGTMDDTAIGELP